MALNNILNKLSLNKTGKCQTEEAPYILNLFLLSCVKLYQKKSWGLYKVFSFARITHFNFAKTLRVNTCNLHRRP